MKSVVRQPWLSLIAGYKNMLSIILKNEENELKKVQGLSQKIKMNLRLFQMNECQATNYLDFQGEETFCL